MKKILILAAFATSFGLSAQNLNYYENTYGQTGTTLKTTLHDLIDDHSEFEYGTIKTIIRQADVDPANANNIILMYTGNSISKWDFANDPTDPGMYDYWNREHTWPKSHGNFGPNGVFGVKGANTDAHHLRPVDMTMNSARSYKDFDNGGTIVNNGSTPTQCKSTNNTWEPRDAVKGDVARMMFYMAARYEGGNSAVGNAEPDLELVEAINTFPNAELGRLSTLLQWHLNDPVDAFELNRNDIIENWQQNRNPFIDHPELAHIVFGTNSAFVGSFSNLAISPSAPTQGDIITVTVDFTGGNSSDLTLYWGNNWNDVLDSTNSVTMTQNGTSYTAQIPAQVYSAQVKFRIRSTGNNGSYISHRFKIQSEPFNGTITSIRAIQGTGVHSPMAWKIVSQGNTTTNAANNVERSVTGIVTGVFGNSFFVQESDSLRSGIYVYDAPSFPAIGDSVIITGKITEYHNLTEVVDVSLVNIISNNHPLPNFQFVNTGDISTGNASAEDYESVLVKLSDATCVNEDVGFGMWKVSDGSGDALIHNSSVYSFDPTQGESYDISGVLNYNFDEFKVELRFAEDISAPVDTSGPRLLKAESPAKGYLNVWFNEATEEVSAETLANFSINNGIQITSINQHALEKTKLIMTILNQTVGTHTLTSSQVVDLKGNIGGITTVDFVSNHNNVSVEENELEGIQFVGTKSGILLINTGENIHVSIWSVEGKKIFERNNIEEHSEIPLFSNGTYFIRLEKNGVFKTQKWVIQ
ncbi:MAG: endonuclease [Flavobacteriales bacterium]|jgi:endonuclease I|nr:endonuclease [Flavobacteriales bacterium]